MTAFGFDDLATILSKGAYFEISLQDEKAFRLAYKRKVARGRRRTRSFLKDTLFLLLLMFLVLAWLIVRNLEAAPGSAIVSSGAFWIGFCSSFLLIITLGIISNHRLRQKAFQDTERFRRVTTGVGLDKLWIYRNHTFSVFSQASFLDIEITENHIFAFVLPNQAHIFVREALSTSDEGKAVLKWLAACIVV